MTLHDLKDEIAALGFENDAAIDGAFIFSVRRAVSTAYSERGIHKSLRLYQSLPTPDFYIEKITRQGEEMLTYSFLGGAYYFHTSGVGSYSVSDESGVKTVDFYSDRATHRGFIKGEGAISFSGKYHYSVYGLCHFSGVSSDNKEDIVYEKEMTYNLREYATDFIGVCDDVRDAEGMVIDGASVCAGILTVPYSYRGEINLKYRCAPPEINADNVDAEIDIDPEIRHLIPLLAASYIWLDDDGDKAQYYMSLYRNGMASLKMYSTRCLNSKYNDVTRWA